MEMVEMLTEKLTDVKVVNSPTMESPAAHDKLSAPIPDPNPCQHRIGLPRAKSVFTHFEFVKVTVSLMAMFRPTAMVYLVGRITQLGTVRVQTLNSTYSTIVQAQMSNQSSTRAVESLEGQCNNQAMCQNSAQGAGGLYKHQIGENVSRKDKINFLISTLVDLKDSKEAVYGALDAWVAWEQNFPIASLKRALLVLEKEQQWHRIVQDKWQEILKADLEIE
ncbi:hypothetical protein L1049_017407 [Liquidambar formosana]|uniref:Uncharacterized protein n=1 Tax=Liquidambar formosana TaxID=63359 RepID=A0AAP0S0T2_LIQFO